MYQALTENVLSALSPAEINQLFSSPNSQHCNLFRPKSLWTLQKARSSSTTLANKSA